MADDIGFGPRFRGGNRSRRGVQKASSSFPRIVRHSADRLAPRGRAPARAPHGPEIGGQRTNPTPSGRQVPQYLSIALSGSRNDRLDRHLYIRHSEDDPRCPAVSPVRTTRRRGGEQAVPQIRDTDNALSAARLTRRVGGRSLSIEFCYYRKLSSRRVDFVANLPLRSSPSTPPGISFII